METLFGQYKFASDGKLDSSNYATARAACMVHNIVTPYHSGKGYRDSAISSMSIPLEKKYITTQRSNIFSCYCSYMYLYVLS